MLKTEQSLHRLDITENHHDVLREQKSESTVYSGVLGVMKANNKAKQYALLHPDVNVSLQRADSSGYHQTV